MALSKGVHKARCFPSHDWDCARARECVCVCMCVCVYVYVEGLNKTSDHSSTSSIFPNTGIFTPTVTV